MAEEVNTNVDNIGARRLHTILERILEDVSFDAPEKVRCGLWGGGMAARCRLRPNANGVATMLSGSLVAPGHSPPLQC